LPRLDFKQATFMPLCGLVFFRICVKISAPLHASMADGGTNYKHLQIAILPQIPLQRIAFRDHNSILATSNFFSGVYVVHAFFDRDCDAFLRGLALRVLYVAANDASTQTDETSTYLSGRSLLLKGVP
jgi:hypothetical protein